MDRSLERRKGWRIFTLIFVPCLLWCFGFWAGTYGALLILDAGVDASFGVGAVVGIVFAAIGVFLLLRFVPKPR